MYYAKLRNDFREAYQVVTELGKLKGTQLKNKCRAFCQS